MGCLLPYLCMVTVPHIMVGLERMLDYRGVGLARFHCTNRTIEQRDKLITIETVPSKLVDMTVFQNPPND